MKTYNKSLSQVMNQLHEEGYKEQFKLINNEVLAISEKQSFKPNELKIVDKFQFDGMTNPSDESTLYAIKSSDGLKGTLVLAGTANAQQDLIKSIPTS